MYIVQPFKFYTKRLIYTKFDNQTLVESNKFWKSMTILKLLSILIRKLKEKHVIFTPNTQ